MSFAPHGSLGGILAGSKPVLPGLPDRKTADPERVSGNVDAPSGSLSRSITTPPDREDLFPV